MPRLCFFDSPHPLNLLIEDPARLADAVAEGVGYRTDEEYFALTAVALRILQVKIGKTDWDNRPIGSLGIFAETDDTGVAYTYMEVGFSDSTVASLPVAMQARFDQETAETFDSL